MLSASVWIAIIAVTITVAVFEGSYRRLKAMEELVQELEAHLATARDLKRRLEVAIDEIRQLRRKST